MYCWVKDSRWASHCALEGANTPSTSSQMLFLVPVKHEAELTASSCTRRSDLHCEHVSHLQIVSKAGSLINVYDSSTPTSRQVFVSHRSVID